MADDKKNIPEAAPPAEAPAPTVENVAVPEQPAPEPVLTDAEAVMLEHEGHAAPFEMGDAVPDPADAVTHAEVEEPAAPKVPKAEKEQAQPPDPGKDDPAPAHSGKVVDFAVARDEVAKEEKKAVKQRPPTEKDKAAKPGRGRPPKDGKAAPDKGKPPKPRDKVSQGGVRQQASIPVVLACCVSPPNSGRRSINLRRRFTVKLTTQELEQMKSVDIGAVAAESLPDVSGMTFDNALSRKERISRFLQTVKNPYCFCIGGVGVKIEFAESGPSLQDKLTDFLLRQRSGL